jgi:hypothetical protein
MTVEKIIEPRIHADEHGSFEFWSYDNSEMAAGSTALSLQLLPWLGW